MSKEQESLKTEIYGLLKSRGFTPIPKDSAGDTVPIPEEAEVFQFMFSKDGKDYGKVWVTLDGLKQVIIYYGKEVADSPKNGSQDSNSFSQLTNIIKRFATSRQLSFERSDQSNLEADMAKREHTKRQEQVNEGYYPIGKNASGNNNIPSVTMRIQHTRPIEEGEQRYRNIARIFVENQDGERILLPTTKPGLARTYVRHIAEGGKPNDERWNHLNSLCEEYQKMAGFVRATRNGQFNESAQSLVNEGINHYQKLRETLGKLSGKRGYNEYFESYTPALMEDEEQVDLSEMFMSSSLDPRIESVMPILSKLSRNITETKKDMAETIALEEWADSLTELSNEKLGQYKKAASVDASAADAAGNTKRGDKRFKGIVKATIKQLDNDVKKHYDGKEQGVGEGEGNFDKALDKLSGSWSGWYKDESSDPNIESYWFDDGEGGYYASGTIEHDLRTGKVTVDYSGDEYHGPDVKGTFDNFGEAMRALRGDGGNHGGRAPNFDKLGHREPHTSDDLRKTDRTGRKGTIGGGFANKLKGSIQANKGNLGPKGVLPEQGLAEGGNDTVNALVSLRATVKQIQTGRSKYPQGFASQLEVALYDAINALRDSQEQGAQNTVNELAELRAVAKQVQSGKMEFPQGYTGHLEWVLYDAIKQIQSSSQGVAEDLSESKTFGPDTPYEVKPGEDFSKVFEPGRKSGVHYHLMTGSVADPFYFKLNNKLYSVSQNGDGIPREVGVDDNDLGNDVPMPSLIDYGKSSTQDPNLQLAKDYAKLMGHDPEDMDEINPLLYAMKSNPRVKADFEREVEWARRKNQGVSEGDGDPQIPIGMETQYGPVVSVKDDIVTVRASNGELTTVNITDIDQAMGKGDNRQDINDPLDPNRMDNRNRPTKRNIQSRLGHDERGDARVRAGQERSTHARNKPQLPESTMDDNAIWSRYGHYSAGDLQSEFPNISPEDAEAIVKNAEKGWTDPTYKQKYRDNVVALVKQVMAQPGLAEGTDPILARIKKLSGL